MSSDKNLQALCNYLTGRGDEEVVEVLISHPIGSNRRRVRLFASLPEPTGIFIGYNKMGDGAVIRTEVGEIRAAARLLSLGLLETVEVV